MRVQWKGEGQHPGRSEEGGRGVRRRRRRCGGAGLATRRAPPHPTISIVVALLCVVCEWGATQHLSRVPAAQVTVTNPGERGLIPAQPYWPPTIPPPTRQLPTPSTPTSPKHARAHLSKIESGVRVQDHGHRKAPAGATQLTPTVEFAALRPHPLHEVFVDKPDQSIGVGWTLPEGLATQPSVVRSGHQSTTVSSNATSQETLDLSRTSKTDANGLHLLINTSSSDTPLGVRGETATSKLKSWLGEFREPAATVHSPFTNSGQFPKPKSSQENDQGNTKEGNQTLEHQSILAEQLDDGATTDPTVAITRARTASGIITVPKHNSPTPMTKPAETFPQVQDPVAPLGLGVRGMAPHLDNKAPAQLPEAFQSFNLKFPSEQLSQFSVRETNNQTSQDSQTTTVNFSQQQQQGITVPTNFPLVSLRPHGGYLPLQHHVTQQSNVTNGSHSSSSKLHITTSWQPVTISPLPVNFLQSPANITQQLVPTTTLVSRPYRQFGRPAIQKQRPLQHHLVHRHHLPRHSQTQLPIIPKFRNAFRTPSHQISVIPQSSLGEASNNTHERLTQHKDSVSFPQRHNNTHLINNNHNLSYRQQAHDQSQGGLFGEVFELLNKKISKEEIARDYHYDDYYYDDYYYDYDYYEDHTEVEESTRPSSRPPIPTVHHTSTTNEPAFAPHARFPGRPPPAQHSRPRATLGVIPTRPRFRHPITLPPSFVPPRPGRHRTVQTSKPKEPHLPSEEGRQVRPHGALRDESSFPTLPAHNHRPSHVAASLIPSERPTYLVQDPPHAEHDLPATHRGSPPTHHTIKSENSLSSSSSGNISAQLLPQQENSGATTLSSLRHQFHQP
ncbi:uncharacterized protein [Panulirus ornatus]|uniref:uncharacterized protein isoform X1 n=1 Tax=Panulirus ornatus TaxID=150431 RepID=UPI003A8946CB